MATFTDKAQADHLGTTPKTWKLTSKEQQDQVLSWLLPINQEFSAEPTLSIVHEGLVIRRLNELRGH